MNDRCSHGVRWPHECVECVKEIDLVEASLRLAEEEEKRRMGTCPVHLCAEPCPTCAGYIAAGL